MHNLPVRFLNREREIERLDALVARGSGFAVVYGRRRIGKTRLLVDWVKRQGGVYSVADQSAAEVQRRYFADAVATRLPGFADVTYLDWRTLLSRVAREAAALGWRGPLVLDELPYLVIASPELPAVLQRWLDHEAKELVVVVAGSSQHMMHGLVLAGDAPLFGRAHELFEVRPLHPSLLRSALGIESPRGVVEAHAAWGGVPRYWELAEGLRGELRRQIDHLVLDPMGPLHLEPDRLIVEDLPPATEVRPLLDAIGAGAHRVSEIGARLGRPATSLGRPLQRLQGMGLVRREVPFGVEEKSTKRSLYRIADPFTRLWFRVVAPHRGALAMSSSAGRLALLARHWPQLLGEAWEELCRGLLPTFDGLDEPFGPPSRWWAGSAPEWDVVAASPQGTLLLGEAKQGVRSVAKALRDLAARPAPPIAAERVVRVLFLVDGMPRREGALRIITARELLGLT